MNGLGLLWEAKGQDHLLRSARNTTRKYILTAQSCALVRDGPPGKELELRGDSKLVRFYHRGELVKVHPNKPPSGRSTDQEDYPPERTACTLRSPNYPRQQYAKLGEAVGTFADNLLSRPVPWPKLRQASKLLRLGEKYTPARPNAACEKTLAVALIDVCRLERIRVEALEEAGEDLPFLPQP